jgi:hypothetical protein
LLAAVCAAVSASAQPASDKPERAYQERLCADMQLEHLFPDGTRADCLDGEFVIEVDFSKKWAESIGKALHYGLWTDELPLGHRKIGIILVCQGVRDTCTDHIVRAKRVLEDFELPVTLWDCEEKDVSRNECQVMVDQAR